MTPKLTMAELRLKAIEEGVVRHGRRRPGPEHFVPSVEENGFHMGKSQVLGPALQEGHHTVREVRLSGSAGQENLAE